MENSNTPASELPLACQIAQGTLPAPNIPPVLVHLNVTSCITLRAILDDRLDALTQNGYCNDNSAQGLHLMLDAANNELVTVSEGGYSGFHLKNIDAHTLTEEQAQDIREDMPNWGDSEKWFAWIQKELAERIQPEQ